MLRDARIFESCGIETALISFTGVGCVAWEANLVDFSNLDRFGAFPLILEVGDN